MLGCVSRDKANHCFALQSGVEGSRARNKQIWKSNQQPPTPTTQADLHLIPRSCFIYQSSQPIREEINQWRCRVGVIFAIWGSHWSLNPLAGTRACTQTHPRSNPDTHSHTSAQYAHTHWQGAANTCSEKDTPAWTHMAQQQWEPTSCVKGTHIHAYTHWSPHIALSYGHI